jgi:amino acid adenylation domain-containing protein
MRTEELIGFFVNTLVLRIKVEGNPSYRELLKRVRQVALGAYSHQDLPFEKLVQELQPQRDPSRSPLFQIMFAFQNVERLSLRLKGVKATAMEVASETSKFDLLLTIGDNGQSFVVVGQYNADLFDQVTVRRYLKSYHALLEQVVRTPETRVFHLPMVSDAERAKIFTQWNAPARTLPPDATIHELFRAQARLTPANPAIFEAGRQITYAELEERTERWARVLRAMGVAQEEIVGVWLERSAGAVTAFLAILKAGGAYLPLEEIPPERAQKILQEAEARILITDAAHSGLLSSEAGLRVITIGELEAASQDVSPNLLLPAALGSASLAYVIYTSGSTGGPKGVMVPHGGVVRLVRNANYVPLNAGDCLAHASTIAFDAATFEIWGALLNGGRLAILSREQVLSPEKLKQAIAESAVTTAFVTTALFNKMVEVSGSVFQPLKFLTFGGEAVNAATVKKVLREGKPGKLLHVYGPTENTTFSTWHEVPQLDEAEERIPIGGPVTGTEMYLLGPDMELAPVGGVAEIYLGGAGLARGYLKQPDLTAERFVPHPFGKNGELLYRTGDLARYVGDDGDIEFIGRKDGQVKIRGFRIEAGEIENALMRFPKITEAVVIVRTDNSGEKRLIAYVVKRAGEECDGNDLRRFLQNQLAAYMVPASFIFLDNMPLNANGKIDRNAMPSEMLALEAGEATLPPQTGLEKTIASIWIKVLKLEQVGLNQNFFEIGGHSLALINVHQELETALGKKLSIITLFQHPTINSLAEFLEEKEAPAQDRQKLKSRAARQKEARHKAARKAGLK